MPLPFVDMAVKVAVAGAGNARTRGPKRRIRAWMHLWIAGTALQMQAAREDAGRPAESDKTRACAKIVRSHPCGRTRAAPVEA